MNGISVKNVSFSYGTNLILKDINLDVSDGDFICLLGPSGCGKSTLLRLLAGLAFPSAGEIRVSGSEIKGPGLDRGVVFQDYSLFPWMSTGENVVLAVRQAFPGKKKAEYIEIASSYLEMVGLETVYNKLPSQLSGGMRQRAAIARAFATNPPVLLMDEPFGALDPLNRASLQNLLVEIWSKAAQKKTVVFVTHDTEEALFLADRIIIMGGPPGRVISEERFHFSRPRKRSHLLASSEFQIAQDKLLGLYRTETLKRLDEGYLYAHGDGV